MRAFERVNELRETRALKAFVTGIAVNVAREAIRYKHRRRWLMFLPPEETPEIEAPSASPEAKAALRAFYDVLGKLDTEARIAFALRYVEGLELAEVAAACDVSLATIKRRLKSAEIEFIKHGERLEALAPWIEESPRWRPQS